MGPLSLKLQIKLYLKYTILVPNRKHLANILITKIQEKIIYLRFHTFLNKRYFPEEKFQVIFPAISRRKLSQKIGNFVFSHKILGISRNRFLYIFFKFLFKNDSVKFLEFHGKSRNYQFFWLNFLLEIDRKITGNILAI